MRPSTTTYNGRFPGPLLRLQAGNPVTIDFINETASPQQIRWHGLFVSPNIDGVSEERTPEIPAHGRRRIRFTPGPVGFRFYHTHTRAGVTLRGGSIPAKLVPFISLRSTIPDVTIARSFSFLKNLNRRYVGAATWHKILLRRRKKTQR